MALEEQVFAEDAQSSAGFDKLAEQSVLGAMMLNREAVWDVVAVLSPTDFYDARHEDIARAIVGVAHRNEPTDAISIVEELTKLGQLVRVGGAAYVHELVGVPTTWTNASHYAEIVLHKALRRGMVAAGETIANLGRSGVGDVFEQVEAARARVDELTKSSRVEVRPIGDSFDALIEAMDQPPAMVSTPWRDLDDFLGGLRPGKLYVVGARPAMGKSIIAVQVAVKLATKGNVAFASLEMSTDDIQRRLISQFGEVNMDALMNGRLSKDDWDKVAGVRERVRTAPIYVSDEFGMNITQVKAFARSTARKGKLSGVIVDYLQLMTSGGKERDRHEIVGEISRQLKIMSRELDVPVVALSQLNRQSEARKGGEPSLSDLRESGAIEQDADAVLLLHRDEKNPKTRHLLKVIVAKNRFGRTGAVELVWQGQFARVLQRSTVWTPTSVLEQDGLFNGGGDDD